MSRRSLSRNLFTALDEFRARFAKPRQVVPGVRRRPQARLLAIESLEGRMVLSANPGASILGTAYNDLSLNGLTADDPRLSAITVNLFKDGSNGTFQGSGAGSDDTLIGSKQTDGSGKYRFDNLEAGTYYVQEITPAGYVKSPSGVATVVVTPTQAKGTNGLIIDSFLTTQQVLASSLGPLTASSTIAAPGAVGGHRDMFVELTTGVGEITLSANAFDQHLLEYNSSATGSGNRTVTWDGDSSGSGNSLNPTGLNHLDLTGGGLNTGISVSIGADHEGGVLSMKIYKDASNWSTVTVPVPNTGGTNSTSLIIPFSSFTIGGGSGAGGFTDVGAVQMQVTANAAFNGQISLINTIGPTLLTTDLANYQPASVGDLVFWDLGKTGIQAASNPPAQNVQVQLLQNGQVVATTTTNAQGQYSFTNLVPGAYSAKFIPQNGAVFTLANQGANPALDSDVNPATGTTAIFNLLSGQNDTTHDAGLLPINLAVAKAVDNPTPTVGSNVTFTMTVTNASGYSPATGVSVVDVLPAGLAFVSATAASGTSYNSSTGVWTIPSLPSGLAATLTITATATTGGTKTNVVTVQHSDQPDVGTVHTANASVTPPASFGDFVFWDITKSGIQTPTSEGVPNVTVQLLQNGSVIATTQTNAQGLYHFAGIAPGTYSEKFIAPNGAVFTQKNVGGNPDLDSDVDPSGLTAPFTLVSGVNDTSHDAGLLPINLGITKSVNNPTPTVGSNVVFTVTLANASGYSPATGVTVNDVLPAGMSFVSATPGSGTNYNSGTGVWTVGNLASGASVTLTITATVNTGGTKTNVATVTHADEPDVGTVKQASAAVTPPGSIGDRVFWDMNADGVQDSGEAGVPNITVQLLQNGSVVSSTTTNAQGTYQFNNVAPGTYTVKVTAPSGIKFTSAGQGDDAADSDVDPATGITAAFALASGQSDTSIDAGLLPINLGVTKDVDNQLRKVDELAVFTMTITNATGYSNATGVQLHDLLPAGLAFVSAAPGSGTTYNSSTGTWNVGSLVAGATATLTITARATDVGLFTNELDLTAANEPDAGTIREASASVLVEKKPPPPVVNLSITKTVDNPIPKVGTNVVFTVTVTNAAGPFVTATNVVIHDALPPGLQYVSSSTSSGTYDQLGGVWIVDSLDSGASATLNITATVTTKGLKVNTAEIISSNEPDIGTEHTASAQVLPPVKAPPKLSKAMFLGR